MNIAVLGLGVDTNDVIPYLEKRGDQVTVFDEAKGDKFENLEKFDLIIRSPGVYRYRPEIVAAEEAGAEISSKTKLFFDLCPAKIIGVTGTKGKGTTATLIYEILKAAGKDVYLGGNIGTGLFEFLPKLTTHSWAVLELSSFQLIDLHKSPHISVVLMVTSEHLNWHKNESEYVDAKAEIVLHQADGDFVVANKNYPNSVRIAERSDGKIVWVSGQDALDYQTKLRGKHNRENIAAAAAVARTIGISEKIIKTTVANFSGLEHRLEEVATVNEITFYNDSFSTTPETAIAAIKAFTEPEIVIMGGSSKNSDFRQLGNAISNRSNIKAVMLIGVEGSKIDQYIEPNIKRLIPGRTMAEIVEIGYNNAASGDIVLLSPACASFDMFKSYKDRGQQFKDSVKKLASYDKSKKTSRSLHGDRGGRNFGRGPN